MRRYFIIVLLSLLFLSCTNDKLFNDEEIADRCSGYSVELTDGKSLNFYDVAIIRESFLSFIIKEEYKGKLKSIEIPEGIKFIEINTFMDEEELISVTLPATLSFIRRSAFENCINLKNINFPQNLKEIHDSAFYSCECLTDISLPDSLLSIGNEAFFYCTSLKSVRLSKNLKYLGDNSFAFCILLSDISIPEGIDTLRNNTFYYCKSLRTIELPDSLKYIRKYVFFNTPISKLKLPLNVEEIGKDSFKFCDNLKRIYIKRESSEKIKIDYSFWGLENDCEIIYY